MSQKPAPQPNKPTQPQASSGNSPKASSAKVKPTGQPKIAMRPTGSLEFGHPPMAIEAIDVIAKRLRDGLQ